MSARNLSGSDSALLARGAPVVIQAPVEGSPWPRVTVFRRLAVPPEVAIGVFLDYESAPQFMSKLESVKVTSEIGQTKEVEYRLRLPVLMSVGYKTSNTYSREGFSHVVKWELLSSSAASSGCGEFRVDPWGSGSLVIYSSEVVPVNWVVSKLKSLAVKEVESAANALSVEAIRRSKFPAILAD